jgi:hypothetical protein
VSDYKTVMCIATHTPRHIVSCRDRTAVAVAHWSQLRDALQRCSVGDAAALPVSFLSALAGEMTRSGDGTSQLWGILKDVTDTLRFRLRLVYRPPLAEVAKLLAAASELGACSSRSPASRPPTHGSILPFSLN